MSNSISLVGRVGQEPELKHVGDYSVLEFSVANDVGFGDKKVTNWFRCTVWGKRATSLQPYLNKGKQVFVIGELALRKYTTNEGVERISPDLRVDKLDFVGDRMASEATNEMPSPSAAPASPAPTPATDDDMPF